MYSCPISPEAALEIKKEQHLQSIGGPLGGLPKAR
jgi:hypothetical protein